MYKLMLALIVIAVVAISIVAVAAVVVSMSEQSPEDMVMNAFEDVGANTRTSICRALLQTVPD